MTKKLGIGIIGCGGISGAHASGYLALAEQCEIRAVSDLFVDKAERLAASIGADVHVYQQYQELLDRPDIDVVSICTPPYAHKQPVIDALKAGKHVLVEKPFAASLQDCDEMMDTAKATGKKLCITFQYRYRQDFNQIRHLISSGALGPITFAQMSGLYWRGDAYYAVPWRGTWDTECGGVTMNHASIRSIFFCGLWASRKAFTPRWRPLHMMCRWRTFRWPCCASVAVQWGRSPAR